MALNADMLLERIHLKNQARRWRILALGVVLLSVLFAFERFGDERAMGLGGDHIARFSLDEIIMDDPDRAEILEEIEQDDSVKALILRIDSPGGTTVASEEVFLAVRRIAEKKPVVATMRSFATSGGYLAAIGADYLVAREGTITGSIGVIVQSAEMTGLAKKIGIEPIIVRSGELKAAPTPLEKMDRKARRMLEGIIDDFYQYFLGLVQERRELNEEQVNAIADGRVLSARQALELNLIDEIGGEKEARDWLEAEHKISDSLNVREYELPEEENPFKGLFESSVKGTIFEKLQSVPLDGMAAIWHPTGFK